MAGRATREKGSPVWPGLIAPLGLTFLLGVAAWLFVAKVDADQEAADQAALELEKHARLGAEEIISLAARRTAALVEARRAARKNQERNLRLETRGVLDSVHGLLASSLDKAGRNALYRREVGRFPPGFEGVAIFLEIPPPGERDDAALAALRSASPELALLLPAGSSLIVTEDNSRELLALGGVDRSSGVLTAAMVREFIFNDGESSRDWSLRVEVAAPDDNPSPSAAEMAEILSNSFAGFHLDDAVWNGWLLNPDGSAAAAFTAPESGGQPPPAAPGQAIGKSGEWIAAEAGRLLWLERGEALAGLPWIMAAGVAIDRPAPSLELAGEFWRDRRWSVTLPVLLVLSLSGWIWFFRNLYFSADAPPGSSPGRAGAAGEAAIQGRLVRDETASRDIPEVQGVIVAEIGDDGRITLHPQAGWADPMPSGSLLRLQAIHRGRDAAAGSRVLDQAGSQVLRELAERVRPPRLAPAPPEETAPERRRSAKTASGERFAKLNSPGGWPKVQAANEI